MPGADHEGEPELPAGAFSTWLEGMKAAIRSERGSDVPCNGCTACCRSSQFVHIGPDETDTLGRIPAELLFPAPRLPRGHVVLGYDDEGCCPMLVDDRCSIYEHRPRACRVYDCRVFAAAGIDAGEDKPDVSTRARRWRFAYASSADRNAHDAVRAAASFFDLHGDLLVEHGAPASATQRAVLAVEMSELFLERHNPDADWVRVQLARTRTTR